MILVLIAILLVAALIVWMWKVPLKKAINAMKKSGSSAVEAYVIFGLLVAVLVAAAFMIFAVV